MRSRRGRRLLLALALAAGAGVALAAPALAQGVERAAPDYSARPLGEKGTVELAALRGDVVLLNTWATWCKPCREEMPAFEQLYQKYRGDGLRIVGVNIDQGRADGAVTRYVRNAGITFPIWRDPTNRFADLFRVLGPPETFLVDRDGVIRRHWRGQMDPHAPENLAAITGALEGTGVSQAGMAATAGLLVAFGAGLISVLSPCVLPLVPSYASVVAGVSMDRSRAVPAPAGGPVSGGPPGGPGSPAVATATAVQAPATSRGAALRAGLAFVAGFSSVFMVLGVLVNTAGAALADQRVWLTRMGGLVLIVFGLHLLGVIRLRFLDREARLLPLDGGAGGRRSKRAGYLGAFLVGVAFAAGWSPCVGPVLAGILTMAASGGSTGQAAILLGAYSAGLAIPFLLAALALDRFLAWSGRLRRSWLPMAERVSGALVVGVGVILVTGAFTRLAAWLAT